MLEIVSRVHAASTTVFTPVPTFCQSTRQYRRKMPWILLTQIMLQWCRQSHHQSVPLPQMSNLVVRLCSSIQSPMSYTRQQQPVTVYWVTSSQTVKTCRHQHKVNRLALADFDQCLWLLRLFSFQRSLVQYCCLSSMVCCCRFQPPCKHCRWCVTKSIIRCLPRWATFLRGEDVWICVVIGCFAAANNEVVLVSLLLFVAVVSKCHRSLVVFFVESMCYV